MPSGNLSMIRNSLELPTRTAEIPSEPLSTLRQQLLESLVLARRDDGAWVGQLSASALSTATAISALSRYLRSVARISETDRSAAEDQIRRGLSWLRQVQNADGGWGDTAASYSNISTTLLVLAAAELSSAGGPWIEARQRAEKFVTAAGGVEGVRRRYGRDHTFSVPILSNAAMAGLVPWKEVAALPFEAACLPQRFYHWLRLPVVSYAIPALVAIGQAKFFADPPRNPWIRWLRQAAVSRSLRVLRKMQPASGGFLEAVPLTSFVALGLIEARQSQHPVVSQAVRFLLDSFREEGSWPIDTNLAIWTTTLLINALGLAAPNDWSGQNVAGSSTLEWLLDCQNRERHPFTGAAPGGWGWSDLSGSVPDADDTPGVLLALRVLGERVASPGQQMRIRQAAADGVSWLLGLQNRDGGWPTFCRGWGRLPFDRSGADLTAHAIRGLLAWKNSGNSRQVHRAIERGFAFLARHQQQDGSWLPLWFGNQDHPREENPWYGTSKVLLAYAAAGRFDTAEAENGLNWLVAQQQAAGGWGGGPSIRPEDDELGQASLEETALCLDALGAFPENIRGAGSTRRDQAIARGFEWLQRALTRGEHRISRPIGFYFAKLWYDERLYPQVFALAALNRVQAWLDRPQRMAQPDPTPFNELNGGGKPANKR